jgi:hypothetical protein
MSDTEPTIDPIPGLRHKPRQHETICINGRTKWRLDALCLLGRRSRSATIELLIDAYLQGKPGLRSAIEERRNDPKPIQLRRGRYGAEQDPIPTTTVPEVAGE